MYRHSRGAHEVDPRALLPAPCLNVRHSMLPIYYYYYSYYGCYYSEATLVFTKPFLFHKLTKWTMMKDLNVISVTNNIRVVQICRERTLLLRKVQHTLRESFSKILRIRWDDEWPHYSYLPHCKEKPPVNILHARRNIWSKLKDKTALHLSEALPK